MLHSIDAEDTKCITYAQLQKQGFLVDDEEPTEIDGQQQPQSQQQQFSDADILENARFQMYSQVGNNIENMKYVHYVHNDLQASRGRRSYAPRRRQPFQLYKCEQCDADFVHRTHLKIHQRTHTGEKPYKCEYCSRCFAQKGNLHVHIKIHTGEKDFICEFCHRGFITNAQLFVHMRTHTNPNRKRPYATGRPPKIQELNQKKDNEGTPNQIIVQLVQDDEEQQTKQLQGQPRMQNSCPVPNINADSIQQLGTISDNNTLNSLESLQAAPESSVYDIQQVSSANLNNLTENGGELVQILVAQQ